MPNYRIDLILADGQIGQTLLFFCFDDERALAWGKGGEGISIQWSLLSRRGVGGQQAGRQIGTRRHVSLANDYADPP